jgi:diguanylate cyclase (GGDEF)-like protein/PAS domain S-box-containing protein
MTAGMGAERRSAASMFRRARLWLRHEAVGREAALLNALPLQVAVLDGLGVIVSVNEAWRQFDLVDQVHAGASYFQIRSGAPDANSADAHQMAEGVRSVLAGTATSFSMDYACDSVAERHWFTLTATPLMHGRMLGGIVTRRDITSERGTAETLRASELQFRQMAENIRDVFFLVDAASHHVLYISPAYEGICGLSCASLYANPAPWSAGVHPDDRVYVQQKYETGVLADTFGYECRILRPDGSLRWIEVQGSPVFAADGRLVRVAGTIRDITQRRHSLQALHDSRERINSLVLAAAYAIVTVDERLRIVLSNPAAECMFGYTSAELRGQPLGRVVPDAFRISDSRDVAPLGDVAIGHKRDVPRPVNGLRRNGESFQLEASVSTFDADGRRYFTAMLRDLSERQRSTDQLRECRRRLSDLLSNVELLAVMLDQDAVINYCNDYFLKLTGWNRAEVTGRSFSELFVPPERRQELRDLHVAMLTNLPRSRHHENTILTRSGEHRLIRWNNSVLRSEHGDAIGITSIGEDVTEQQRSDINIKRLSRVYAVLSEINTLIVRAPGRQDLFDEACRIAVEAGTFQMAWIGTINPSTLEGVVVAWHGGREDFVRKIKLTARDEDTRDARRPASRALRLAQPVLCNDVSTDPCLGELRDELLEGEHKSLGCFPLMVGGRATAVFALYAAETNAFDEGEARLLAELAGNISFALDHVGKQERLTYLAYYDELTGLANRRLFLERAAQLIRAATAAKSKVALGIIDLERFKNINQSLGRPSGDALLRQVADWFTHRVGDASLLAHLGADQFAVLFPDVNLEGGLGRLMEQTTEDFKRHPFRLSDTVVYMGAKVGLTLYPDDGTDVDLLLRNAEAALRKAKAAGERYLFYAQRMTETVVVRLNLEHLLREAVDQGQFVLYYQPKVNQSTDKLTGAEALIRWNDPRGELVLPGKFISVLEESGLIHEVGRWALQQAISDYLRWRSLGLTAVRVSVNVSALQLRNRSFIDEVKQAIGVDPAAAAGLELEITESVIMEDVRHTADSLRSIRAMGVSIAIDDFGTGFSSLAYLSRLSADTLKIDRSFVQEMTVGQQGVLLVAAIINLAHSLKLKVVAEGVETEEQAAMLRSMGCDELQGYLFGRPTPSAMFESRYLVPKNLVPRSS